MNYKYISLDGAWNLAYGDDGAVDAALSTAAAVSESGLPVIPAVVPGNFELDLARAGIVDELFYGKNILQTQDYETYHMFYFRTFEYVPGDGNDVLVFDGLDCCAEIYIDGTRVGSCANMLIAQEFPLPTLAAGTHELFVHIAPAVKAAQTFELPPYVSAMKYSWDSLYVRKAPHMYGWDIMPRAVSGGIWKHVRIECRPKTRIRNLFVYTAALSENAAQLSVRYNTEIASGSIRDYSLSVRGICGDSVFEASAQLWHTSGDLRIHVDSPKLWFPRNYGEPHLYEFTATLSYCGETVDTQTLHTGIRTIALDRTSTTDTDGGGEFCFRVNGVRIFAMGTNWVPVDAFHSRDEERLPAIMPMLDDLGCNIVRCWGGNVYENDIFYDYCDAHGILVWQDFAMACALYPQDKTFQDMLEPEVISVVKRLRNHPCLALWAGDNECDYSWDGDRRKNPNDNVLTRRLIPEILRNYDPTRPYLPSSPYMDEEAFRSGKPTSEDHLWGPRDYFKGDFYKNTVCHFASETGYHGCPSPASLARYIPADKLWPCVGDDTWLIHCASPEEQEAGAAFSYRIRLMYRQVQTLFGEAPDTLADFAQASQISQAEAKKYFIERFRLSKWRRTGIIWWNLIDGWPQISDAIVDYYHDKKLAYSYIKRSQAPFCMMFDEPENGACTLYAVNDTREIKHIVYSVRDDTSIVVHTGTIDVEPDVSIPVWNLPVSETEKRFYLIEWDDGKTCSKNHYVTNLINMNYSYYLTQMKSAGFEMK